MSRATVTSQVSIDILRSTNLCIRLCDPLSYQVIHHAHLLQALANPLEAARARQRRGRYSARYCQSGTGSRDERGEGGEGDGDSRTKVVIRVILNACIRFSTTYFGLGWVGLGLGGEVVS